MKKVIIIGGGAAGFFTAINAKEMNPELDITILEKGKEVLQKVTNHCRLFSKQNEAFRNFCAEKSWSDHHTKTSQFLAGNYQRKAICL